MTHVPAENGGAHRGRRKGRESDVEMENERKETENKNMPEREGRGVVKLQRI